MAEKELAQMKEALAQANTTLNAQTKEMGPLTQVYKEQEELLGRKIYIIPPRICLIPYGELLVVGIALLKRRIGIKFLVWALIISVASIF